VSDKPKFPHAKALAVGERIVEALSPVCARIQIAGSLRRKKELVGDVEIVYVPKFTEVPNPQSLFGDELMRVNAADLIIQALIERGALAKRPKPSSTLAGRPQNYVFTWGEWIKLAVAVKTGVPVDLFATTQEDWWNVLVCRTGSAESNTRIAGEALRRGWQWNPSPSGGGFRREAGNGRPEEFVRMNSEQEVFEFVGLKYLEPDER